MAPAEYNGNWEEKGDLERAKELELSHRHQEATYSLHAHIAVA